MLEISNGLIAPLNVGASITYAASMMPDEIIATLREEKIISMLGVPLFLKAMKRSIELKMSKASRVARAYLQIAAWIANRISSMSLRRVLFAPLHRQLGGSLRNFFIGGAALDAKIVEFFHTLGIHTVQGYGMTEASPVIAANSIRNNRIGSVGKPMAGVEVKIVKDNPDDKIERSGLVAITT